MISPVRRIFPVLILVLSITGCDKDLQQRVDRLEAELREVRSDTRDDVTELKNRVISAETTIGVSSDSRSFESRLSQIEGSLAEVLSMSSGNANEIVYLRPNLQGHAPIATDHGTFLVRMEGMDLNLDSGGYNVHLNIGNPMAISVEQFTLSGSHGGGTPQLPEGEEYTLSNPTIRAWQETLIPFEARVTKTLEPFSWTPFDIELEADSRDQLEMIRFSMSIENARLKRSGAGSDGSNSFAHINVGSESASVLRTEYGAFLIAVKGSEETENGTRLSIEIGNPYGFTLNQCRLIGEFGTALPVRTESANAEEFAEQMRAWSGSLQPFEAMISSKVASFRWNRATILIPATEEKAKFLRCQLRIEDITLPAATDR
ncbi:MAG: hypothetical protein AAGC68_11975 [Verrucomicrobiota bacterium]